MSEKDKENAYFGLENTLAIEGATHELAGVPELDQPRILARARELLPHLEAWTKPYPSLLPLRVPSICVAAAAILPDTDLVTQLFMSRLSLITFALDDLVDGALGSYSEAERYRMLDEFDAIVKSHGAHPGVPAETPAAEAPPWQQVSHALGQFCQDAYALHQEEGFYELFSRYIRAGMEGMKKELEWQREVTAGGPLPSYEDYMESAMVSILSPAVQALILAIQLAAPTDPEHAKALEQQLDEITLTAGICVRLANDLRSFARERAIEKKPNAVWIMASAKGIDDAAASAIIEKEIDAHCQKVLQLIPRLPAALGRWGDQSRRLVWFSTEWYKVREFHHFSKEMLERLAAR
jgi:hypothetical protein